MASLFQSKPYGPDLLALAKQLGVNPKDPRLMLLVEDMAKPESLPARWSSRFDSKKKKWLYTFLPTGEVSAQHPSIDYYRGALFMDMGGYRVLLRNLEARPPTEEEINRMNEYFAIGQEEDLYIREVGQLACVAPLPEGFEEMPDETGTGAMYKDKETDIVLDEHPLDAYFRELRDRRRRELARRRLAALKAMQALKALHSNTKKEGAEGDKDKEKAYRDADIEEAGEEQHEDPRVKALEVDWQLLQNAASKAAETLASVHTITANLPTTPSGLAAATAAAAAAGMSKWPSRSTSHTSINGNAVGRRPLTPTSQSQISTTPLTGPESGATASAGQLTRANTANTANTSILANVVLPTPPGSAASDSRRPSRIPSAHRMATSGTLISETLPDGNGPGASGSLFPTAMGGPLIDVERLLQLHRVTSEALGAATTVSALLAPPKTQMGTSGRSSASVNGGDAAGAAAAGEGTASKGTQGKEQQQQKGSDDSLNSLFEPAILDLDDAAFAMASQAIRAVRQTLDTTCQYVALLPPETGQALASLPKLWLSIMRQVPPNWAERMRLSAWPQILTWLPNDWVERVQQHLKSHTELSEAALPASLRNLPPGILHGLEAMIIAARPRNGQATGEGDAATVSGERKDGAGTVSGAVAMSRSSSLRRSGTVEGSRGLQHLGQQQDAAAAAAGSRFNSTDVERLRHLLESIAIPSVMTSLMDLPPGLLERLMELPTRALEQLAALPQDVVQALLHAKVDADSLGAVLVSLAGLPPGLARSVLSLPPGALENLAAMEPAGIQALASSDLDPDCLSRLLANGPPQLLCRLAEIPAFALEKLANVPASVLLSFARLSTPSLEKLSVFLASTLEKLAKLPASILERLVELPSPALERLTDLPTSALERLASLPASALERLANVPAPVLRRVADVPAAALEKLAELSLSSLEKVAVLPTPSLEDLARIPASDIARLVGLPISILQWLTGLPTATLKKLIVVPMSTLERLAGIPVPVLDVLAKLPPPTITKLTELTSSALERLAELPTAALERLAELPVSALEKLASVPAPALRRLADVSASVLEKLADVAPPALERLVNVPPSALEKLAEAPASTLERLAEIPGPTLRRVGAISVSALRRLAAIPPSALEKLANAPPSALERISGVPAPTMGRLVDVPPGALERLFDLDEAALLGLASSHLDPAILSQVLSRFPAPTMNLLSNLSDTAIFRLSEIAIGAEAPVFSALLAALDPAAVRNLAEALGLAASPAAAMAAEVRTPRQPSTPEVTAGYGRRGQGGADGDRSYRSGGGAGAGVGVGVSPDLASYATASAAATADAACADSDADVDADAITPGNPWAGAADASAASKAASSYGKGAANSPTASVKAILSIYGSHGAPSRAPPTAAGGSGAAASKKQSATTIVERLAAAADRAAAERGGAADAPSADGRTTGWHSSHGGSGDESRTSARPRSPKLQTPSRLAGALGYVQYLRMLEPEAAAAARTLSSLSGNTLAALLSTPAPLLQWISRMDDQTVKQLAAWPDDLLTVLLRIHPAELWKAVEVIKEAMALSPSWADDFRYFLTHRTRTSKLVNRGTQTPGLPPTSSAAASMESHLKQIQARLLLQQQQQQHQHQVRHQAPQQLQMYATSQLQPSTAAAAADAAWAAAAAAAAAAAQSPSRATSPHGHKGAAADRWAQPRLPNSLAQAVSLLMEPAGGPTQQEGRRQRDFDSRPVNPEFKRRNDMMRDRDLKGIPPTPLMDFPDELQYKSYRESDIKFLKQRIVRVEMQRSQMGAKLLHYSRIYHSQLKNMSTQLMTAQREAHELRFALELAKEEQMAILARLELAATAHAELALIAAMPQVPLDLKERLVLLYNTVSSSITPFTANISASVSNPSHSAAPTYDSSNTTPVTPRARSTTPRHTGAAGGAPLGGNNGSLVLPYARALVGNHVYIPGMSASAARAGGSTAAGTSGASHLLGDCGGGSAASGNGGASSSARGPRTAPRPFSAIRGGDTDAGPRVNQPMQTQQQETGLGITAAEIAGMESLTAAFARYDSYTGTGDSAWATSPQMADPGHQS